MGRVRGRLPGARADALRQWSTRPPSRHRPSRTGRAGAPGDRVYAEAWKPRWGAFAGDSQALVTMHFANGRRAFYEGALTNAIQLNGWSHEYIRAECELATLILDHRR